MSFLAVGFVEVLEGSIWSTDGRENCSKSLVTLANGEIEGIRVVACASSRLSVLPEARLTSSWLQSIDGAPYAFLPTVDSQINFVDGAAVVVGKWFKKSSSSAAVVGERVSSEVSSQAVEPPVDIDLGSLSDEFYTNSLAVTLHRVVSNGAEIVRSSCDLRDCRGPGASGLTGAWVDKVAGHSSWSREDDSVHVNKCAAIGVILGEKIERNRARYVNNVTVGRSRASEGWKTCAVIWNGLSTASVVRFFVTKVEIEVIVSIDLVEKSGEEFLASSSERAWSWRDARRGRSGHGGSPDCSHELRRHGRSESAVSGVVLNLDGEGLDSRSESIGVRIVSNNAVVFVENEGIKSAFVAGKELGFAFRCPSALDVISIGVGGVEVQLLVGTAGHYVPDGGDLELGGIIAQIVDGRGKVVSSGERNTVVILHGDGAAAVSGVGEWLADGETLINVAKTVVNTGVQSCRGFDLVHNVGSSGSRCTSVNKDVPGKVADNFGDHRVTKIWMKNVVNISKIVVYLTSWFAILVAVQPEP